MGKRKKDSLRTSKTKMLTVLTLFALIWVTLLGRAAWLQLYKGGELSRLASRQHLAAELERGERGRIFDRNGNLLATSVTASSVYARPVKVKNASQAAYKLSKILNVPASEIRKKLSRKRNFVWIKRQLDDRTTSKIVEAKIKGIYLLDEHVRLYPNNYLAGQLLGFTGIDGNGLEGIEKKFNKTLAGKKAQFVMQRDASGRRLYLDAQGREVNIKGQDLYLTINAHLQSTTEMALAQAVKRYKGKWGTAIVVEVKSGDVLALANCPRFNPNIFRKSSPAVWRNRAATDVVEPGSTMKPFLMAAALDQKVITPVKLFDCENGRWNLNGKYIKDTHKYGWLPAHKILRYSSNIGSAKIGLELGAQNYFNFLSSLGFGKESGLPISGERNGLIRPPEKWNEIDLAAAAFGQGIGITTLQMAKAYLAIANKGIAKPLHIVRHSDNSTQKYPRVFSPETAEQVLSMMREVVQEDGTGVNSRISGTTVAGKTGTAQIAHSAGGYGKEYLASFVALVPGYNPEYIVYMMVYDPKGSHYGSTVAAPYVRKIMTETLAYYNKLPEKRPPLPIMANNDADLGTMPKRAMRTNHADFDPKSETIPDLTGKPLRRAVEILVQKGFVPLVKGQGLTVKKQTPSAGEKWPDQEKGKMILWLS